MIRRGAICTPQGLDRIRSDRQPCRGNSEKNARQQRDGKCKAKYRQRRRSLDRHWIIVESKIQNHPGAGERHHDACEAAQYGQYLAFAAGTGQAQGPAVGQVPAGYLPMTTADGLGAEVAYTQAAATDVTKQNGQVPPLAASKATGPTTATTTPANRGPGGQSSPGSTSGSSPGATTSGATSTPASGSTASTTVPVESGGRKALTSQAESAIAAARAASSRSSLGKTIGLTEATGAVAVLVALILAIVGGVLSGVQWWRRRRPVGS